MQHKPRMIAKIESDDPAPKLAVLIDADNAQASVFEALLAEIAKYGEATVKRIYGDFTNNQSAQWKKILNQYAIKPVQQFAYTTGKNATDSALIIDTMDLLYTRRFDGFCIISSDSDYTGLAIRIKKEGLTVYGFGEEKTPDSFRNACNKFILTEVLRPVATTSTQYDDEDSLKQTTEDQALGKSAQENKTNSLTSNKLPVDFFKQALEQAADDSGWSNLGTFGSYLTKLRSDFDSRRYGYKKLSDLVKSNTDIFMIEERRQPNTDTKSIYIRAKD